MYLCIGDEYFRDYNDKCVWKLMNMANALFKYFYDNMYIYYSKIYKIYIISKHKFYNIFYFISYLHIIKIIALICIKPVYKVFPLYSLPFYEMILKKQKCMR